MIWTPGAPASSPAMTSLNARPIQETEASGLRFSKRRIAMRGGVVGRLAQEDRKSAKSAKMAGVRPVLQAGRPALQNTRFQHQQLLELGKIAEGCERRVFAHLLAFFEAFFERFAQ